MPAMPIENSEKVTFRPLSFKLLLRRFLYIQHDWDSVFVVGANHSLVSVGGVWKNRRVFFDAAFGRFEVGQLDVGDLEGEFLVVEGLREKILLGDW